MRMGIKYAFWNWRRGGFNWKDGWSNHYSYSIEYFQKDLPKTDKLIIFYDEGTSLHGKTLQELNDLPNKFIIGYSKINALLIE